VAHASLINGDPKRMAVAGESSGGNLAAAAAPGIVFLTVPYSAVADTLPPLAEALAGDLLSPEHLAEDIPASLNAAEMAKRQFREIARVAGLGFPGFRRAYAHDPFGDLAHQQAPPAPCAAGTSPSPGGHCRAAGPTRS